MGRNGGHECGKCGGSHQGICPAYYDEREHLQDQCEHNKRTYELKASKVIFCIDCGKHIPQKEHMDDQKPVLVLDGQCSKCGTFDDVHECWHCDISLCIECDPGEMRSDHDGHTYCHKHGPNSE